MKLDIIYCTNIISQFQIVQSDSLITPRDKSITSRISLMPSCKSRIILHGCIRVHVPRC